LFYNFALEYAIRRVKINQDGLKLNGAHQLMVYADYVNILGRSVHTVKGNTQALVVYSKEIGLEVNVDKTKYRVMSWDQNAGRSDSMKIHNSSFETVEEIRYLGTNLTDQNSIQEEIKSSLKSGNACYHSVQNFLSSSLLSCNIKIKIHAAILLPDVLYGCETWSLTLREESRLRVFDNRVLRRIFWRKRDKVTGERRKLHEEETAHLYSSLNIVQVIKSRRMRWAGNVARMGGRGEVYTGFWWENLREGDHLEDLGINNQMSDKCLPTRTPL
jgi:hypothetical protein